MITFIITFCWAILSIVTRKLTNNSSFPIWWKKVLAKIITAPSLLSELILKYETKTALTARFTAFAAWLTR